METMQTIPGLLAAVGLIPTASAKPGCRNDVSEPLYGVLESSEMHPVKSMMTFPVLGGGVTRPRIAPTSSSVGRGSGSRTLAVMTLGSSSTSHYIWDWSQGGLKETSAGVNPSCTSA